MDYLKGKYVKSNKTFKLLNCIVDNEIHRISDAYTPSIYAGNVYKIIQSDDNYVTLGNLQKHDWVICELSLDAIDDFKFVDPDTL